MYRRVFLQGNQCWSWFSVPPGTLWFQKCNQATEWGSTYARISAENFMTFKKRNLYADTKEPVCERLLVLSFIRGPRSTNLPERTILESSELDSLYRSTTLNTTSTILAKKEASVLRKPPTPNSRRIHRLPQRHTQLASPYRCYIEIQSTFLSPLRFILL